MRLLDTLGSRAWRPVSERTILCNRKLPDRYGERDKASRHATEGCVAIKSMPMLGPNRSRGESGRPADGHRQDRESAGRARRRVTASLSKTADPPGSTP
jgi:hypothetical protein